MLKWNIKKKDKISSVKRPLLMFDNLMLFFLSLLIASWGFSFSHEPLCMCISDDIEVAAIAIDAATILEIKGKR